MKDVIAMEENARTAEGLRFGCPGCGSGLRYDIASGQMHCDNCGQSYDLTALPDPSRQDGEGMMEAQEYRCPQCGAAVHTSQTAAASFCSYCGADVLLTQRLTRIRRPSQVVPFSVTREQCEQIYRRRVQAARYAPDDFVAQETLDHFRPVYIPFWRYKGKAAGDQLAGSATHRHSDSRYDYTDQYSYTVAGNVAVGGVIYDASVSFEDETARQLAFSIQHTKPFHAGYLCGFYAESPDTEPSLYEDGLREYARNAWNDEFSKQCKYNDAKVAFPDADFTAEAELILMPVWLLAHRSGGRVVYTAVNGDSGQIVCDTPVSNRRFAVLTAELAAMTLAVLLLLHFLFILRPRLLAALCGMTLTVAQWIIARVFRDIRIRRLRENDPTWLRLHPDPRTGKIKKPAKVGSRSAGWFIPLLITGVISLIGAVFTYFDAYNTNAFLASLISDHGWLAPVIQLCALVLFLIPGFRRRTLVDDTLYFARLALLAVTLVAAFVASTDMVFYLCGLGQLILTAVALARLNGAHNEFVSRPVPFFNEGGEQA